MGRVVSCVQGRTARVAVLLAAAAGLLTGCGSSPGKAPAPTPVAACKGYLVGPTRVGQVQTYRLTTSVGSPAQETLRLRAHSRDTYTFARTFRGRATADQVYRLRGCVVELPSVVLSRDGLTDTISGLTLPALSRLGKGAVTKSLASVTFDKGAVRVATRPVFETVTGRGRQRITVPAGTFDAQVVELDYTIDTLTHTITDRQTSWISPTEGTLRAVTSTATDGLTTGRGTLELISSH